MIIVADNLQITNPRIARAIDDMDAGPICELVKTCESAGAQAVDINPGPLTRHPEKMAFLVEAVQSVTNLPLLLDTTNPKALQAGLSVAQNPAIINGFSLEPAKLDGILPLAEAFQADIIGYLLSSDSQVPAEEAECLDVAAQIFEAFQSTGLDPDHLIIDPVIAPMIWENGGRHNQAVLAVLRHLPDLLGFPVRTIAGLSNLTTGPAPEGKRLFLETTFVPMIAAAGLTYALMNIHRTGTIRRIQVCELLLRPGIFAWEAVP
ncbi:MAG: dihydropteroate synthase [Thermodesulfobacteriota bacterium]|nr:dihydropteroate synthase [Thermodesulfobacteriota bacterium]